MECLCIAHELRVKVVNFKINIIALFAELQAATNKKKKKNFDINYLSICPVGKLEINLAIK